jgi:AcrR family transcriptional regulator
MPRVNRSGVATRERILDAAAAVLAREGVAGFTLQAVAAEADIRYGNLTHHYPTRDGLVEAMFSSLLAGYRAQFEELAQRARDGRASVRDIVEWLLDDAVSPGTAPVFLQLWSMAAHQPEIARGMEALYDQAVDAFLDAHGIAPRAAEGRRLREALYLLGTVIEGSSAIFWTRDRSGAAFRGTIRDLAIDTLTGLIEARLGEARAVQSAS